MMIVLSLFYIGYLSCSLLRMMILTLFLLAYLSYYLLGGGDGFGSFLIRVIFCSNSDSSIILLFSSFLSIFLIFLLLALFTSFSVNNCSVLSCMSTSIPLFKSETCISVSESWGSLSSSCIPSKLVLFEILVS